MTPSGVMRVKRSARRPEIARAEAVETCCAMITSIKVAKEAGRCRGGGGPISWIAWLICWSAPARWSSACCSKAWSSLFLPGMILPSGAGIVTRFAPSPTGHLHLGHAYSALQGFRTALANLESLGVLYPCFCSRKDIAAAASAPHPGRNGAGDAIYPGTCRDLH